MSQQDVGRLDVAMRRSAFLVYVAQCAGDLQTDIKHFVGRELPHLPQSISQRARVNVWHDIKWGGATEAKIIGRMFGWLIAAMDLASREKSLVT